MVTAPGGGGKYEIAELARDRRDPFSSKQVGGIIHLKSRPAAAAAKQTTGSRDVIRSRLMLVLIPDDTGPKWQLGRRSQLDESPLCKGRFEPLERETKELVARLTPGTGFESASCRRKRNFVSSCFGRATKRNSMQSSHQGRPPEVANCAPQINQLRPISHWSLMIERRPLVVLSAANDDALWTRRRHLFVGRHYQTGGGHSRRSSTLRALSRERENTLDSWSRQTVRRIECEPPDADIPLELGPRAGLDAAYRCKGTIRWQSLAACCMGDRRGQCSEEHCQAPQVASPLLVVEPAHGHASKL